MNKKQRRLAIIITDLLTFAFSMCGLLFTLFNVRFMGNYPRLTSIPYLLTFTGLSNLFVGLACLACSLVRLKRKDNSLPSPLFVIKIVSLAEISITFVTTALYLAPNLGNEWWRLYLNASLFNHFLTPVTAIVGFLLLEEYKEIPFKYCFFSLIPVPLYSVMYVINVYTHLKPDGSTDLAYDIYGFMRFGVFVFILFFIGFVTFSFGLTVLYRLLNKQRRS